MQNKELFQAFKTLLTGSSEGNQYAVLPILETSHKLGTSTEGYPKFFLRTSDKTAQVDNKTLNILNVEYNVSCTFVDGGTNEDYYYTIITLRSVETILQEMFFDLMLLMISRLQEVPTKREIAIEVENLISIFKALECPSRTMIQGLWSELLVIEQSKDPEVVAMAWHNSPSSKYDFTMGKDKIEVKSTSSDTRAHNFALDQIIPSAHSRIVVASAIVRESAQGNGGLSYDGLYDLICKRVNSADVRFHILQVISETLGTDIYKARDVFFDYPGACDSLAFFDAQKIPGIKRSGIDEGVSSIGFRSDLSGVPDIYSEGTVGEYLDSPLYQALFNV